ncbi:hypothetical protein [Luteolibacter flavescens]|nr:hypothetical protein [Luteolibacter flavescens]
MRKITALTTCWAAIAGLTAYADPSDQEMPPSGTPATATVAVADPSSLPEANDPFAAALAIMSGEASARADAGTELPPAILDSLHSGEHSAVPSVELAGGKVSSFRIDAEGVAPITVSEIGGLRVGETAVDTHFIEIAGKDGITAGTYTLIDYEGLIGGAGFSGLVLRNTADLQAKLVHNTAETKIELVISEGPTPDSFKAAGRIGNLIASNLRSILGQAGAYFLGDRSVNG